MAGLLLLLPGVPGTARAQALEQPGMRLSWGAPEGMPGATDNLEPACGDTTQADTLYLVYRLKDDHPAFTGTTAIIMFHTVLGDSLTPFWKTSEYPEKPTHLRVEFPSDTGNASFRSAATSKGFGDFAYYTEPERAIVRLIFAVPPFAAAPVAGGRDYCMARIIIDHDRARAGCGGMMCVEWFDSEFKFSINQPTVKGKQGHASFVTIHSASGLACSQHRINAEHRGVVKLPPLPKPYPGGPVPTQPTPHHD